MRASAACCAVALAAWGALPGAAQSSARAKREHLKEVQKQLEQKRLEIEEYKRQSETLKRDLSRLADESTESRRKMRTLQEKIRDAEARKSEIQSRLGSLQLAEDQWQRALTEELNAYVRRTLSASEFFGRQELWEGAFRRAAIIEKLRYVSELHGTRRRTQALEAETLRQKRLLQAKTARAEAEHESRETSYRRKKEVYDAAQQRLQDTQRELQELRDSAAALTHLVQALGRRAAFARRAGSEKAPPPRSLAWPVAGKVVSVFGRQQVPELHTWVINHGIRIETQPGAPVRPVKAGKVIFAGPFRSYGRVMILDHGQEFFTIYGNLGELRKRKGDSIGPSEPLGTAGPSKGGGELYLEIRQSGNALDPLAWLEKH